MHNNLHKRTRKVASSCILDIFLFLFGLFLLSVPAEQAGAYPAYLPFLKLIPSYIGDKDRFLRAIAAIITT